MERMELYAEIFQKEIRLKARDQEAQDLYDSIVAESERKKALGQKIVTPVGYYKTVVEQKEAITIGYEFVNKRKHEIVKERAPVVKDKQVVELWEQRVKIQEGIDDYYTKKAAYDQSPEGKRTNFLHVFFLVSGTICMMFFLVVFFVYIENLGL